MMVGTVNYMPPEQAMGGEVTPRSDLYSLGCMLYEMVTGRPPFVGDESVAIIGQHLNTPPVAPTWHRPDCPPGLESLILRLMEKDASKRPASAAIVREALLTVATKPSEASLQASVASASPTEHNPLYRRTFVGREQEVRQLQQAFDAALSGQGGLVMVVGEPGIGKTALCEQLMTYVAMRGGRGLAGHCYEEGSLSQPYLAFVEAMRSYVLAREPDDLRSDLGTGAADVARIVSEVRDRVVDVDLRPAGDPEDDRWRLFQAVTAFLRNASSIQPLCIVLEDLHWADRGTLDLLLHVARNLQGARLLIVGNYRDVEVDRTHPLSGVLAELRRLNSFGSFRLRGLTVDEVHRMYEAVRGNAIPWGQAEAVFRATEGNPLFVQEVLRYLVEEGVVVRQDGRYEPQQGIGAGIPEGLRDVVGKRLNRLDEQANQVLTIAAVIGRDFRIDVLEKVSGLSEEDIYSALEEAQERAIIEQRQLPGAIGFRFTHAFFRETLYEEIFAPRRIRLHQQVGKALEQVHARRLEEHAAELAEHFAQSTETADLVKAVEYSERAAQRASSVFDYGEAVRHLRQAIRAQEVLDSDDATVLCDLYLALSEAMGPGGEPERAIETAELAYKLATDTSDTTRASRACSAALYGMWRGRGANAFRNADGERWVERADQHARPLSVERVHADLALGQRSTAQGSTAAALNHFRSALGLARDLNDAQGLFRSAVLLMVSERGEERLALAEEFWNKPRYGVSSITQSGILNLSCAAFLEAGNRDRVQDIALQLRDLYARTHEPLALIHTGLVECDLLLLDGRLEDAIAAEDAIWQQAKGAGMSFFVQRGLTPATRARLHLGEAESVEAVSNTDDRATAAQRRLAVYLGAEPRLMAQLERTFFPQGAIALETAALVEFLESGGVRGERATAMGTLVLLETSILSGALRHLEALVELAKPSAANLCIRNHCTNPARLIGEAEVLLGHPAEARKYFDQALEVCRQARFRPEIALINLDLAELLMVHYPDESATAIEHLDFAIGEFREMKMQPSLERALGHRDLLKA